MLKEFKDFISRGNVMDMSVGVIIGAAFTSIVKSFTSNLINPLLGIFLGKINFSSLVFTVGKAQFRVGSFINSVINFLIVALVIFLLLKIIRSITHHQPQNKETKSEQLLTEIRDLLKQQNQ